MFLRSMNRHKVKEDFAFPSATEYSTRCVKVSLVKRMRIKDNVSWDSKLSPVLSMETLTFCRWSVSLALSACFSRTWMRQQMKEDSIRYSNRDYWTENCDVVDQHETLVQLQMRHENRLLLSLKMSRLIAEGKFWGRIIFAGKSCQSSVS